MEIDVFLACMLNHILFDFVFQEGKLMHLRFPSQKNSGQTLTTKHNIIKVVKGNIIHASMHFIGLILILIYIIKTQHQNIEYIVFLIIFIYVSHFIVDLCKSILYVFFPKTKNYLTVFLFDQLTHLILIFLVCFKFDINRGVCLLLKLGYYYPKNISLEQKLLCSLLVFFIATWCTGIFIKIFIKKLDTSQFHSLQEKNIKCNGIIINENGNIIKTISQEAKNGGMIIGILERIFIIISIMMNYSAVIGFILTAKSFARLNKLTDESFAEYFIIGNFISFIAAILAGILLKKLLLF